MPDAAAPLPIDRRTFLKGTAAAIAGLSAGCATTSNRPLPAPGVVLCIQYAHASPVHWAATELAAALRERHVSTRIVDDPEAVGPADWVVFDTGDSAGLESNPTPPAEASELWPGFGGPRATVVAGGDARGFVYALLELADRVRHSADPIAALRVEHPIHEEPASRIRSVMKCFCSEPLDKPWWTDREQWRQYLTMLVTNRFNRFALTLGVGYNSARGVTDGYFVFPYPFFVAVPGYDVKATGLPDAERDANLELLRFVSHETARRGLQFQLGLWTHGYIWPDSPDATYLTTGLTPNNHAAYCRDALAILLKECPAITGVTLRAHGESGVPDGQYGFWKTLFETFRANADAGRRIEIDIHAKGIPQETLDLALATGQPVTLSPKFSAEHQGLPYHQAAIRELEQSPRDPGAPNALRDVPGQLSAGNRKFTRYGYADLLATDRKYNVLFRVWPGTQRFLLWADPESASAFGRAASFCGSAGIEFFEPLSFRGRKGTGDARTNRCAYADVSLNPRYDWEKYLITYRLLGRCTYDPDCNPDVWKRWYRREFGAAAHNAEWSIRNASRGLPLMTTAHLASADCTRYWPEVYTDMPIVDAGRSQPYNDTPQPRVFGNVSPLDPQLFASVNEWVDAATAKGGWNPWALGRKYGPLEVADWLDWCSRRSSFADDPSLRTNATPSARRLRHDALILKGIADYFAGKLRVAVLWRRFERSGDAAYISTALRYYRAARQSWARMAERADAIYIKDLAFGTGGNRGHWSDRLAAIDADIADMQSHAPQDGRALALDPMPPRPGVSVFLDTPDRLIVGEPARFKVLANSLDVRSVDLWYRRVNQADVWQSVATRSADMHSFIAELPVSLIDYRYSLQYYFVVDIGSEGIFLVPFAAAGMPFDLTTFPDDRNYPTNAYLVARAPTPVAASLPSR